jgi:thiol-disulfide isomerase/thioredoxin
MTQEEQGPVHAPEFPANAAWLQGGPLRMSELRGKPVLIDFWDYTCVNCIRTLPYVVEWHRRYKDHGLVIVGVHAPEFSFAHNADHVRRAVAGHRIEYPVVIDNDYAIWQAYANRYWPAKYLIDKDGYIKAYHYGEGGYADVEGMLQQLIKDATPDALLPGVMDPVRETDAAGAVCYRVTPELYLGYQRGRIGNTTGIAPDKPATYQDMDKHAEGYAYLEGGWQLMAEGVARPVGAAGESRLHVRYLAKEVNLVIAPPYSGAGRFELLQNGSPLAAEDAGEDVMIEEGRAIVQVDTPRMYRLINNREIDTCDLTLSTTSDGISFYAFTFVSCLSPS